MKILPALLASVYLSLPLVALSADQPPAQPAEQAAKQDAAAATKAPTPPAADQQAGPRADKSSDAEAEGKDDAAAPGGKVPSPADVAKSSAGKGTPQRFTPSEQVRPDFDVSFPVDI